MISRYADRRGLRRYLAGAAVARAGDEMSGPALLLLGFAVTGRPETGSGLLAGLTIAGAAGGPLFGALLDRSRSRTASWPGHWPATHWASWPSRPPWAGCRCRRWRRSRCSPG